MVQHPYTHRDRDEHTSPLDLSHVRDGSYLMRLEAPEDVPGLSNYADPSVVRSDKEAIGACGDAGDFIAFEELLDFLGREIDLGDVEEVKRLPLRNKAVSGLVWKRARA
jgi:hypothetical protein